MIKREIDFCVSSLCRTHANPLYIVSTLSNVPNIIATSLVHVVVERGNNGSYMNFKGASGYSQTVR